MFLADRILESYTRALKVFWKVFGIGGGIATVVALGLAIFGGYNELFAYVGGVWLLGLSICAVLSLTLFYGIAVVGIGLEFVWEIMSSAYLGMRDALKEAKRKEA